MKAIAILSTGGYLAHQTDHVRLYVALLVLAALAAATFPDATRRLRVRALERYLADLDLTRAQREHDRDEASLALETLNPGDAGHAEAAAELSRRERSLDAVDWLEARLTKKLGALREASALGYVGQLVAIFR